ncbi:MAG: hypothetical protein F6K28_00140 [Microcoleus sp. SIO2G3]|nr:hypothetical protein [Microcoleus sp. SIO2G3]
MSGMGKRGVRSQKGQAESDWGEPKTAKTSVVLTETGRDLLKERTNRLGISISELLERWARGVEVDQGDFTSVEQTVSVNVIVRSLSRLSKPQLIRVFWAIVTLLFGKPEPDPELMTIEEAIRSASPNELGQKAGIPPERVSEIQKGGDIYHDELVKLARVFDMKPSELKNLVTNRVTNGCNS